MPKIRDKLRPYQVRAVNSFYASVRSGNRSVVLCAPTGSGKTVIAASLIEHAIENRRRVNFIVDRDVLVKQTSQHLHSEDVPHGIVSGKLTVNNHNLVNLVSAQAARAREFPMHTAHLCVVDEMHVSHKYTLQCMAETGCTWLGLSASPFKDGLGDHWQDVINVTTTNALQDEGFLSRMKIYVGTLDVSKKTSSGEYDLQEASMAVIGDSVKIAEEWEDKTALHFGGPVKTIVFANTVHDAEMLAAVFRERGHDFRTYHYGLGDEEKEAAINGIRYGDFTGLVSVEALQRGFDVPDILCGIDAHPWRKSLSSVVQQAGRVMRPAPGKEFALWLDHAQNTLRHREPLFEFWANGIEELVPLDTRAGEDKPNRDAVCPECGALMFDRLCAECGYEAPKPKPAGAAVGGVMTRDGELVELEPGDERIGKCQIGRRYYSLPPPKEGWNLICGLAQERGAHFGHGPDRLQKWCHAQYKSLYGHFRRARFDPAGEYPRPESGDEVRVAVAHSGKLFIDRKKRKSRDAAC